MLSHALRCFLVFTLVSVATRPASAQSFYVAGALGADITLASGQESGDFGVPTGGGEALSGAARLGVVLEPRWGIEFEVSRAGEIRETSRTGPVPLPLGIARPTFLPEIESRRRVTTVSATASIRQQVSDNVALAYLGGVVFHRTDTRVEYGGLRGLTATAACPQSAASASAAHSGLGEPIIARWCRPAIPRPVLADRDSRVRRRTGRRVRSSHRLRRTLPDHPKHPNARTPCHLAGAAERCRRLELLTTGSAPCLAGNIAGRRGATRIRQALLGPRRAIPLRTTRRARTFPSSSKRNSYGRVRHRVGDGDIRTRLRLELLEGGRKAGLARPVEVDGLRNARQVLHAALVEPAGAFLRGRPSR